MPPEMPDVVTGEVVASDWGNDIRDRTVQRYASAAARSASIPSPAEGDLSYLNDTNKVYVYDGAAWVSLNPDTITAYEVDGYTEVATVALTVSLSSVASVSLTIPGTWASWKCSATASWAHYVLSGTPNDLSVRLIIDGTVLQTLALGGLQTTPYPGAIVGYRTGMTTTGARTIALQAAEGSGVQLELRDIAIYARAVRLT